MSQHPQQGGASVYARGQIPSTDLATLIHYMVKAYPPNKNPSDSVYNWSVLSFDKKNNRLGINTYGILRRFLAQKDLQALFKQGADTGFLRDITSPPKGFSAKLGGRLFKDNIQEVSQYLTQLKQLIEAEIANLDVSINNLLINDPASVFTTLSTHTKCENVFKPWSAKMVAMAFTNSNHRKDRHDKEVARVISAQEEIQAEDWLDRMANSISETQSHRDDEFDASQREKIIALLRQDFDKQDSQITRFLNFLEDEALSRVRLRVSFAIMESLATQKLNSTKPADQKFIDYVQRVNLLFGYFGAPESPHSIHLDLTQTFGLAAEFSLSQELTKALFYNCLPVWAEWNTQLFESRKIDLQTRGVSIVREVSYRFRVNGKDPLNEMEPAFNARLNRLRATLLEDSDFEIPPSKLRRNLSEVVFLWLVLNPRIQQPELLTAASQLTHDLKKQGRLGLADLLNDLQSWSEDVKELSNTLVALLTTKSENSINRAQRSVKDLYLVVQQGVVDWTSIERAKSRVHDPLIKPPSGQAETIEWFKHIQIANTPDDVIDPLFSVRVRTQLYERTLSVRTDNKTTMMIQRDLPPQCVNIAWRPMRVDENQSPVHKTQRVNVDRSWLMNSGIDIWYDPERLKLRKHPTFSDEDQRQYRAAAAAVVAILTYVILQIISEKLNAQSDTHLPALMIRFQEQGKNAAKEEGDRWIYAISQAVESALMRDLPVRMQGLVADGNKTNYKAKGAAFALSAAFPLIMTPHHRHTVSRVAAIIYTTRPCDDHPVTNDTDGFIFRAKTYLTESANQTDIGYRMIFDRMQTHVVETRDEIKNPKLIVEEVSRLQALGFEHIILISSHFGNRRINRSAQRHSPHTQTTTLDEIATKFPHVCVYTLRRDVFPATRLHTRTKEESAFEAVQISDHDEFALDLGEGTLKQLIPIYTFATLAIAGNDNAARPQSGFCTYFWDADYQVKSSEWRERVHANLMGSNPDVREGLLNTLRGLHFLEAEKQPDGGVFKPVLDPFSWMQPSSSEAAGEIEVLPPSRRKGSVFLSLPALLSHVTESLHSR